MSEHHEHPLEHISRPDDPRRCQSVTANGQCRLVVVSGSTHCPIHSGNNQANKQAQEKLRIYRLGKYQNRLEQLSDHSSIKSLKEEIGVLRMLIEERIISCKDNYDLILQSAQISDLVVKVEKLVSSCNRIDLQLGGMLDKTQAIQLASEIVETISKHVSDEEALEAISGEMLTIIDRISKSKLEEKE